MNLPKVEVAPYRKGAMPDGPDRVTVSTYVPPSQRERWREDAESMGMSQSEFVRSMVQAGRRGFSLDDDAENPEEPDVPGSNPRGNGLKTDVLDVLRREGPLEWAELFEALVGDLEGDLEAALNALRDEDRIRHSPRTGEYTVAEASDGE